MRQINPDVVAAYPITPQTEIVQFFASFVSNGDVDTEFVTVESEHSAMSAVMGASASGARAMTATSSQGMAYMFEPVNIASGLRLPIVMAVANRAISGPINIHCDHSDAMGVRDSGWIQLWSENAQEAYDNMIQAVRIAECKQVLLPVMVCMDGFVISHALENMEILPDDVVRDFVGQYKPEHYLLNKDHPISIGALDLQDYYFEHKRQEEEAMWNARKTIINIAQEYEKIAGRRYGYLEEYRMSDADIALIALGSTAGTAKVAADELRDQGIKVGVVKLRTFRPFPREELAKSLGQLKALAVLDRASSYSTMGGPMFSEVRCALYDLEDRPPAINYIYGLGGRDVKLEHMHQVYSDLQKIASTGTPGNLIRYLGVRE
jgi:pyruvate ferredoxin oxidoreductase alpha subunit